MLRRVGICALAFALVAMASGAGTLAIAAGPPSVVSTAVESVTPTSAVLEGQVVAGGSPTTYGFEYLTEASYRANLANEPFGDGFQGANVAPLGGAGPAGAGSAPAPVSQQITSLAPATSYRYRLFVKNSFGSMASPPARFATQAPTNAFELLDHRGWELVSPAEKGGGAISAPGRGGGVFQAAVEGNSIVYSARFSFSGGPSAPPLSQYRSSRVDSGWSTSNLDTALISGSYEYGPEGAPYRLFSENLSRALLSNGQRCRNDSGGVCPVANPPLPGSGAPPGYRNYYLTAGETHKPLVTSTELTNTERAASEFDLQLSTATPDLEHIVVSSCAALTTNATETSSGDCGSAPQNLYEWSDGSLSAVNLLPGAPTTSPGASIAAPRGAISADGSRVYWQQGGAIYLREGGVTKPVSPAGAFQVASSDGAFAFALEGNHLLRYDAASGAATDLVPAGGVEGVIGASADGSIVYYVTSSGVYRWSSGTVIRVAAAAAASDYPPSTATARVSKDGSHLLFLSDANLTGDPNAGFSEAYLYGPPRGGGSAELLCVSCRPTGEVAGGVATFPDAAVTGSAGIYKSRVLSESGYRVFFDSSDALVSQDTNRRQDVYEWEASGEGTCATAPGCVQLISSGRSSEPSSLIDASGNGSTVYFVTGESLVPEDPAAVDVYAAPEGGGFPPPSTPVPCEGDACQPLPSPPDDPILGTQIPNAGNPPLSSGPKKKKHHHRKRHPRKRGRHHQGGKKAKQRGRDGR